MIISNKQTNALNRHLGDSPLAEKALGTRLRKGLHFDFPARSSWFIMPISHSDLQRVVAVIADEEKLKATVKGSVKGGLVAGLTTTAGGLLAGPIGLLVGGVVGGAIAYSTSQDFEPVSQIINDLDAHQRQLLYDYMKDIIDNLNIEDYITFMAILSGDGGGLIRRQIVSRTIDFLGHELKLAAS